MLEDAFRKNQAGILACGLQEGSSCPVCGSVHHPELAKLENSEITEEAVKHSNDALEMIRDERDKKLNKLTDIKASLKSIKENSIDPAVKELLNNENVEDVNGVSVEVNDLTTSNNDKLVELRAKIEKLSSIIKGENEKAKALQTKQKSNEELRNELQSKNDELVADEGNLRSAKTTLDTIKGEFKGEIKTVSELEEIAEAINKKLQELKRIYDESETTYNMINGNLYQEKGRYESIIQEKEKAEEELKGAIEELKNGVFELGFKGYEDYKASSLTEESIQSIEKEINDFNIRFASAKQLYEASLKDIEGLSRADLEVLNEKLKCESDILNILRNDNMDILFRIGNNNSVVQSCEDYSKAIEKDEKQYEIVGKIANIINGDNSKKISFERYVLASYFEDIIVAANLRFYKMTSGRFELLRKQDIGDKRKGQGLDLEVFDNYTGKTRDVKTLSGGESFKASLAMALGLADVVQAYSGGIQLDTMFIDEGFGTLDSESLDSAIECLMDLQNDGRLVGIISHVPELKERINAKLEVTSTNRGSMALFKV